MGIIGEVALTMLLGGAVGFERETAAKPAGRRTHMLVAGTAAFFVAVALGLVDGFAARTPGKIGSDPIRIIQAVIVGVSVLASGTIVRMPDGERVRGLTAAAPLWMSSGIGIAVSLHQYRLAIAVTAMAALVLDFSDGLRHGYCVADGRST